MISSWWLIAAFVAGGYVGILLMALMYVVSGDHDRRDRLARSQ